MAKGYLKGFAGDSDERTKFNRSMHQHSVVTDHDDEYLDMTIAGVLEEEPDVVDITIVKKNGSYVSFSLYESDEESDGEG